MTASLLSQQRCLNHPAREAAARCPQCRHFFCRECVSEHEDHVLCAACLKKRSRFASPASHPLRLLGYAGLSFSGMLVAAAYFYWLAQLLLSIPTAFHDGTLWKTQ